MIDGNPTLVSATDDEGRRHHGFALPELQTAERGERGSAADECDARPEATTATRQRFPD